MSSRSLCKRLVSGDLRVRDVCGDTSALSSVLRSPAMLDPRATLGCRSSTPTASHVPYLRSGQHQPLLGQIVPNTLRSWSVIHRGTQRPFSASNVRLPFRSAAVVASAPTANGAQQQAATSDVLIQSASSTRYGQSQDPAQPGASTSTASQASVAGTIQRVTYFSEETGYTVAKMKVTNSHGSKIPASKGRPGLVTVTGKFPEMAVGQQWTCHGTWTKHRSYGLQLIAEFAEESRPASSDNLVAYLCGGATKGVGPVTAANMVNMYGKAILDVLDSEDAVKQLTKVKGIGARTAAKIKTEWEKRRGDRGMREFLQKHGVVGVTAQKLLEQFGSLTEEKVREDPYTALTKTSQGSTFRVAEKLAQVLGSPPDLPGRAGSAMLHSLAQAASGNGHCYVSWDQLQKDALKLMSASGRPWTGASLQDVAEEMFNTGALLVETADSLPGDACHPRPDWSSPLRCYSPAMFNAEVTVARKLAGLAARGQLPIPPYQGTPGIQRINNWIASQESNMGTDGKAVKLSQGQRAAILQAATSPVCVLTGGPGCGKTTTTKYIVDLWATMGKNVALCAPTGRAAQRLTETSGRQATTIHRLLQWVPQRSGAAGASATSTENQYNSETGGRFKFNARNPLALAEEGVEEQDWQQVDAVLVDEASMLGLPLAAALLEALPQKCQLVFIGDVDQLPPVGPGKVLSDVIQSGVVPGVDLRQIFRQAQQSSIVRTAHAVNNGDYAAVGASLLSLNAQDLLGGRYRQGLEKDAAFLTANAGNITNGIQAVLQQLVQSQGRWNVERDVQVMSPMRKGSAGINELNASLQALLNPPAPNKAEVPLGPAFMSDSDGAAPPVIRVGDRVIQNTNNYQKDVFNGDIGFVAGINKACREVLVNFPVVEREVVYRGAELGELQLAWASTVHKAQGSECPVVILALSPSHRPLLSRRLLYTALTRAKQLVVVVGSWDAVSLAVASDRSEQRLSTLQQRITTLAVRHGATADKRMIAYTSGPELAPLSSIRLPEQALSQQKVYGQQQSRPLSPAPTPVVYNNIRRPRRTSPMQQYHRSLVARSQSSQAVAADAQAAAVQPRR